MGKSERQRQKQAEKKRRKEKGRAERNIARAEASRTQAYLAAFRRRGDDVKRIFRRHGRTSRFYDFLDSYEQAFAKERTAVAREHPTLLGVFEVDDGDYFSDDQTPFLARLGVGMMQQIRPSAEDVDDSYSRIERCQTATGHVSAFRDGSGQLRTLLLIRRSVRAHAATELKYAVKLGVLFHEAGHVDDWERAVNLHEGQIRVIDAEEYANRYALQRLLTGDYRIALGQYISSIAKWRRGERYEREIAERLTTSPLYRECVDAASTQWTGWFNEVSPDRFTQEELRLLLDFSQEITSLGRISD